ncbi:hypothetical protein JCM17845_17720 [Iodidimonas gelatinilytica]|uniref:TfoX N-terminal domain-containing protein n=1 Tax=Iodidimonas gelatinilytica TaxID=1236966 RepID=A0A5A7N1X0_9PROT|nr:TfoX/Sxy family protein [Iodidimonas gelatinilytica]GER01149.1 hypothetical protein JCM17845_17720 [Iodidimonas gelatinilytica]
MAVSSEFLELLKERMEPLGIIRSKRMFGGVGFYCDDLFFAIAIDDALYLKVDDENRARFEAEDLKAFHYPKKDGTFATMSYYQAPESVLDDADDMDEWGRLALDAALRARA